MQEHFRQRMQQAGPGQRPQAGPPHGFKPPSVDEVFAKFDKNKDGKLTKDEVPAPIWEHISKADANKDGAVTKEELEAAHKKMQEHFRQRMQQAGPGQRPQAGPPHGFKLPSVDEVFAKFDKNKDGKLTKDEVPAPIWEHISKADANKDGALTKDELAASRKQREQQRQQPTQQPKK